MLAQMGYPDMRIPIQYALTYPVRIENRFKKLDLLEISALTFEKPDVNAFPCLNLAYQAAKQGGSLPTVLNAANEEAVHYFLQGKIGFYDIPKIVELALTKHQVCYQLDLAEILEADRWAREFAQSLIQ